MTSTRRTLHGIEGNFGRVGTYLGEEQGLRTMEQILRGLGYQTAAFVGATPLKDQSGIDLGFAHLDQPETAERLAGETTDRVLAWLERRRGGPFFLWVHHFDPHGHLPHGADELYDMRNDPHESRDVIDEHADIAAEMFERLQRIGDEERQTPHRPPPQVSVERLRERRQLGYTQ